jgi:type I restriction enzyme S subunit
MAMSELPSSWAWAPLSAITTDVPQCVPAADEQIVYIDIGSIDRVTKSIGSPQPLLGKDAPSRARKQVGAGDTLVSMTRPNLNAVALVPGSLDGEIASTGFDVLRPLGIDPRWTYYLVRTEAFVDAMSSLVQGALYPAVRSKDVRAYQVPVAPAPEQARIADLLDTLLACANACNDRLDAIPIILKRLRQAVLTSAMAGELTAQEDSDDDQVPRTCKIIEIASVGTGSTPLRSTANFYADTGTPWITSAATSRELILEASEFVTDAAIKAHRLKVYPKGTLLVAMYGEGKTRGQVAELGLDATINQACAAINVDENKALTQYVKLTLQANYLAMRDLAEGGNQPNLNLTKIKEFEVPLPSLEEQTKIVRRVEALFALANRIEARYTAAHAHAQRLAPRLLAKAFRGELVSQDPNDEPANALLARIAAERASTAPGTKARQPRTPRAARAPKETAHMTKSRQDDDVKGQPYLAGHLRRLGRAATAEELFKAAELPVADFYKQLAWEVAKGHVKDGRTVLEAGDAA